MEQLAQGVTIPVNGKPYHTKPCTAVLLQAAPLVPERNPPIRFRAAIPAPWISLVLQEGKNRQVRKMTAAVGFPTLRLIRFRIEDLELGTLQPGKMIQLSRNLVYQKLLHE
jgi:23S rRNA pseudouridine2457 synthase